MDTTWEQKQQVFSEDGDNEEKDKYNFETKDEHGNQLEDQNDILQAFISEFSGDLGRTLKPTSTSTSPISRYFEKLTMYFL